MYILWGDFKINSVKQCFKICVSHGIITGHVFLMLALLHTITHVFIYSVLLGLPRN